LNKNILRRVRPELRELYNILEVQFHPLSICKKIEPIMNHLSQDTEMAKYVKPLHQVILTRLFQQLSQVYDSVKLDFVINLASFAPPYNYDAATIEKFIMNGCKKGELSIRIDHATSSLTFETDLFAASKNADADGAKLQASPADRMRDQLSRLAKCFYTTVHMIDPTIIEAKQNARAQALSRALAGMEEEHNNALARKAIIERRRELVETLLMRKEKEEQRERAIRQKQRDEELKQRQMEEAKKREQERKKREREAIQKEEARKLAETFKLQNLKLEPDELDKLDPDKIVRLQVERLEKEKRELNERLRATAKRMDHLERAYRKEEIPLLEKDYDRQRKTDRAYHEAARKLQLETAFAKHTEDLKLKERLMRILPDYQKYRSEIENRRYEEFERRRKAAQAKIEEEKEKRRQMLARLEEERRVKKEREDAEYLEKKRKLDEQARRQQEVERQAEERRKRMQEEKERERAEKEEQDRRRKLEERSSGYVPPARRSESWRRTTDAKDETSAWRRSSETPSKDEQPWRRTGSGRSTAPEEQRRSVQLTEETSWRRSDSSRSNTADETDKRRSDVPRRAEEMEWRRSDSGRGTSTTEDKSWRRTSVATTTREESGSWRRGGPPTNDRGDSKLRSREDSWRSKEGEDSEQSSTSSRGPTRILKPEFSAEPEADEDGFITVSKGKRRG
ncbi:35791_t:CDS:2, partial [Racocetra persica]